MRVVAQRVGRIVEVFGGRYLIESAIRRRAVSKGSNIQLGVCSNHLSEYVEDWLWYCNEVRSGFRSSSSDGKMIAGNLPVLS